MDQLAKANTVVGMEHVLRKNERKFQRRALDFKIKGTRKRGRQKKTRHIAVVEQNGKFG